MTYYTLATKSQVEEFWKSVNIWWSYAQE